ncbi:MAG: hypothetical protein KC635_17075 [Myxococcales bacterium]|nr:hypothetical protein [Myxococcales bacterium]MCB9736053.1 hypothetical protein [Deltaproteobacteria bacterium]
MPFLLLSADSPAPMLLYVGWIVMAVVGSIVGEYRGRAGLGMVLGIFLGLLGVIIVAVLERAPDARAPSAADALRGKLGAFLFAFGCFFGAIAVLVPMGVREAAVALVLVATVAAALLASGGVVLSLGYLELARSRGRLDLVAGVAAATAGVASVAPLLLYLAGERSLSSPALRGSLIGWGLALAVFGVAAGVAAFARRDGRGGSWRGVILGVGGLGVLAAPLNLAGAVEGGLAVIGLFVGAMLLAIGSLASAVDFQRSARALRGAAATAA